MISIDVMRKSGDFNIVVTLHEESYRLMARKAFETKLL